MATVLPPPPPEEKDLWFEIPTTTLEEQLLQQEKEEDDANAGLVEEDSNEFGLTRRDYEFLIQYDIPKAIDDFDREHGFDGIGYHEANGSYIFPLSKVKELNQRHKNKISSQEVAIARGIITVRRPTEGAD